MIKLFKNLGKKEWILMVACIVLVLTQVWLELKMPDYMSKITVLVQTEGSEIRDILKNGGYMLACAFRKFSFSCFGRISNIRNFSNYFNENEEKIIYKSTRFINE